MHYFQQFNKIWSILRWGLSKSDRCDCGAEQTADHTTSGRCPIYRRINDLLICSTLNNARGSFILQIMHTHPATNQSAIVFDYELYRCELIPRCSQPSLSKQRPDAVLFNDHESKILTLADLYALRFAGHRGCLRAGQAGF